jgi:hypothetical protein
MATVVGLWKGRERLAYGLSVSAAVLIYPLVWFHPLILQLIPLAPVIGEASVDSVARMRRRADPKCQAMWIITDPVTRPL